MFVKHLADLPRFESPATKGARELVSSYASPALVHHAIRSALFASVYGLIAGIEHDPELLEVAALLHDLGLEPPFDSHWEWVPFEEASGHVAAVFAAGAGWDRSRRDQLAETIRLHMTDDVDPAVSPEGHLLERATGLDIAGSNPELWPTEFVVDVVRAVPRLDLAAQFGACFRDQAVRKPASAAAAAVRRGLLDRLEALDNASVDDDGLFSPTVKGQHTWTVKHTGTSAR